jgi:protein-disulfide isomerase
VSAKVSKKSSNSGFIIALVGIVVAGGGFIWWKTQNKPVVTVEMPTVADSALAGKAKGYTIGSPTAKVEIVEFGDFECPTCERFATLTEPDIRKNLVNTGIARFTFYDFPLTNMHPNTLVASNTAACADDQGKFWEMHDALFTAQGEWDGRGTGNPRGVITSLAKQVGLDLTKWNACMDASTHLDRIRANYALGVTKRVGGTPTFFVNGTELKANGTYDNIKAAVDAAVAPSIPIPGSVPAPAAK